MRPPVSLPQSASRAGPLRQLLHALAPQDIALCAFHGYWLLRLLLAPQSADARRATTAFALLFVVTLVTVVLVRGGLLRPGPGRALFYRLGLSVPLVAAYLALRRALPALSLPAWDATLLQLDRLIFGLTPALWLERFATRPAVEWFAFFYYGYFSLLAAHLFGALFVDRGRRAAELLLGLTLVTCVGQATYSLVPGVGPFAYAGVAFAAELPGGFFFSRVHDAVRAAGAGFDIFPSLHTAHPLLLALHALRHRRARPFRALWPLVAFAAANMIVSTMFLRFHYACDVLAGVVLAVLCHRVAVGLVARAAQPLFEELWRRPAHGAVGFPVRPARPTLWAGCLDASRRSLSSLRSRWPLLRRGCRPRAGSVR